MAVEREPERRLEDLRRFQSEADRMFLELMGADRVLGHVRTAFRPNVDVYYSKREAAFIVKLELPGINPRDVQLEADERIISIRGQRIDTGEGDKAYQQMEIAYGPFERRVLLPAEVDSSSAKARYVDGFLEIHLPVAERRQVRRIHISITEES